MILVVPLVIPFTTPDVEPIVAIDGALLAHVPPAGVQLSVVVLPAQIFKDPVICATANNECIKKAAVSIVSMVIFFIE